MTPLTPHEIRHAAQYRPGSVAVGAVVVGRIQLKSTEQVMTNQTDSGYVVLATHVPLEKESTMTLDEIRQRVDAHMRRQYHIGLDEMEITDTPGYWQDREPKMHPGHPLHDTVGNQGPFQATYTYHDSPRLNGRYASNTRSWRAIWEAEKKGIDTEPEISRLEESNERINRTRRQTGKRGEP
jgi:hypothetical protein